MKTYLETKFFLFVKWLIRRGYGYEDKRDRDDFHVFMQNGRCAGCDASEVQDWIDKHIKLIQL